MAGHHGQTAGNTMVQKSVSRADCTAAVVAILDATSPSAVELKSLGITVGNFGNPFFVQIVNGTKAWTKEIGSPNVTITAVSADCDLTKRFTGIGRGHVAAQ